jgi:hypothetical protein
MYRKAGYHRLVIALSFYIVCFRLSSAMLTGISPMDEDNPAGAYLAGLFTEPFATLNL